MLFSVHEFSTSLHLFGGISDLVSSSTVLCMFSSFSVLIANNLILFDIIYCFTHTVHTTQTSTDDIL